MDHRHVERARTVLDIARYGGGQLDEELVNALAEACDIDTLVDIAQRFQAWELGEAHIRALIENVSHDRNEFYERHPELAPRTPSVRYSFGQRAS